MLLAAVAALLIVAFNAEVTRLIQLYILGVFLSFTLSQAGMVRHWAARARRAAGADRSGARVRRKQALNAAGAVVTGLVFVIVLVTKFAAGRVDRRRSRRRSCSLAMKAVARPLPPGQRGARARRASGVALPGQVHAVVLVSNLLAPDPARAGVRAGDGARRRCARSRSSAEDAEDPLPREWEQRGVPVPLVVIESPYRETVGRCSSYVRQLRRDYPGDVISIIIPEYVVGHWWQNLLHNQTALRLKARLLFEPSVTVTSVPWVIGAPSDERDRAGHLRPLRGSARRAGADASAAPVARARPPPAARRAGARGRSGCRC